MHLHDLYLLSLAFVSEVVGTVSGFGSSTFFVPLALFLESFRFVLVITAILHCFSNFSKIFLFRENYDRGVIVSLVLPSILFTALGAVLSDIINAAALEKILGFFLVGFALYVLVAGSERRQLPRAVGVGLVAVSGLLTGLIGTGGAIRGMALTALGLGKNGFVMASAFIDVGGDLLRAAIYLKHGYMDWNQWFYVPILLGAAYFGARVGKMILGRINQGQFEKLVALLVLLSGALMLMGKNA